MRLHGGAPGASKLQPVSHAPDLIGLLEQNAVLEQRLIDHYAEAVRLCALFGDTNNGRFFQALLEEEQHHGQELQPWLQSLGGGRSRGYGRYGVPRALNQRR